MFPQWLAQALIGMALIVPGWIAIPFFNRNFGIATDIFLAWYLLGGVLGTVIFTRLPLVSFFPSTGSVSAIILLGILLCGLANLFIFRSVAAAPNPGLAVAIVNAASVIVFFFTAILAKSSPRFFDPVRIDATSLLGTTLTVIGAMLIAFK